MYALLFFLLLPYNNRHAAVYTSALAAVGAAEVHVRSVAARAAVSSIGGQANRFFFSFPPLTQLHYPFILSLLWIYAIPDCM